MLKRSHPNSDISLQEGTADVPNDGYYYVLRGKAIVGRYKLYKKACQAYNSLLDESGVSREPVELTPEERKAREESHYYVYGKINRHTGPKTRTYG